MARYSSLFDRTKSDGNYFKHNPDDTMRVSNTYPHNSEYKYETYIEYIDLDKECERDIANGNGFIVEPTKRNIKKDLKAENGIYSPKFGQTLDDTNLFINRYRCSCKDGKGLFGRLNVGLRCPICGQLCRFVDDNFAYFGWLKLSDKYAILHPAFYKKLEDFFGCGVYIHGQKRTHTKIANILDVTETKNYLCTNDIPKDEPFFGIGMMEFRQRFDEIIEFYLKKKKNKKDYYDDIKEHRHMIFTHSIPVFSSLLRPYSIDGSSMGYEETNAMYSIMNTLVTAINRNKTKMQRNPFVKNQQLYKLQKKYMDLYQELESMLSGKYGDFRCLLGGRYNFSSRNVIVQDPNLRIDEITLPLIGLTVMLEQRIKNILCRTYNMTPTEAHIIWYQACIEPNKTISAIVQSIIDDCKSKGMPGICVLINRNPTLTYGSILQMFCVGFTDTYTMAVPLQILEGLNADFDGDVLNIMLPINQTFARLAWERLNPRNAMYISRHDGYFNTSVAMRRDTLINANTLARCGREYYSKDEIDNLERLFNLKQNIFENGGK